MLSRVAPQVAEQDLAVGRGGEPARGSPENPADAGQVGALPLLLARRVEQLKPVRAGEQGDRRRVIERRR